VCAAEIGYPQDLVLTQETRRMHPNAVLLDTAGCVKRFEAEIAETEGDLRLALLATALAVGVFNVLVWLLHRWGIWLVRG
jgi:hypothetical protein